MEIIRLRGLYDKPDRWYDTNNLVVKSWNASRFSIGLRFIDRANAFAILAAAAEALVLVRIAAADGTGKPFFRTGLEDFHLPVANYADALSIADGAQCGSTGHRSFPPKTNVVLAYTPPPSRRAFSRTRFPRPKAGT